MENLVACFQGRVGGSPEKRYLSDGTPLLTFSAAVADSKLPEGQPAQWVRVTVFGPERVDALEGKIDRGREVYAEGKLVARAYAAKDSGEPRVSLELRAWTVTVLGAIGRRSRPDSSSGREQQDDQATRPRMPQGAAVAGPRREPRAYDDIGFPA